MSVNKDYLYPVPQQSRQKKLPFALEITHYVDLINQKLTKIRTPGLRGYLDCNHFESCQTPLNQTSMNYSASTVASLPDSVINGSLVEISCSASEDTVNLADDYEIVELADPKYEQDIYFTNAELKDYIKKESFLTIPSRENIDDDSIEHKLSDKSQNIEHHKKTNADINTESIVWTDYNCSGYLFAVINHIVLL